MQTNAESFVLIAQTVFLLDNGQTDTVTDATDHPYPRPWLYVRRHEVTLKLYRRQNLISGVSSSAKYVSWNSSSAAAGVLFI